jgi:FlaG/FlaF family flagellin (archaellin)
MKTNLFAMVLSGMILTAALCGCSSPVSDPVKTSVSGTFVSVDNTNNSLSGVYQWDGSGTYYDASGSTLTAQERGSDLFTLSDGTTTYLNTTWINTTGTDYTNLLDHTLGHQYFIVTYGSNTDTIRFYTSNGENGRSAGHVYGQAWFTAPYATPDAWNDAGGVVTAIPVMLDSHNTYTWHN